MAGSAYVPWAHETLYWASPLPGISQDPLHVSTVARNFTSHLTSKNDDNASPGTTLTSGVKSPVYGQGAALDSHNSETFNCHSELATIHATVRLALGEISKCATSW